MTSKPDQVRAHSFDGIQEFDNRLPNWWLWTFYLACIYSVFYWVHYHTLKTGDSPYDAYLVTEQEAAEKMAQRMADSPVTDESLMEAASNPATVEMGRAVFMARCVLCHEKAGEGKIGPNLTDQFWIHGGRPEQVFEVVMNGVKDKGMQAWKNELGLIKVQQVVAFVISIRNTNVPGKDPEGEPDQG